MSAFLVTVKVRQSPDHDPRNKVTGQCPVSLKTCTDVTGAHHTVLTTGSTSAAVLRDYRAQGYHVTRIEEV